MYEKVKHLYRPNWFKEFCFIGLVSVLFVFACFTSVPFLAIVCFGFSQVVCGWLAHSMNHSRDKKLHELGNVLIFSMNRLLLPWLLVLHVIGGDTSTTCIICSRIPIALMMISSMNTIQPCILSCTLSGDSMLSLLRSQISISGIYFCWLSTTIWSRISI